MTKILSIDKFEWPNPKSVLVYKLLEGYAWNLLKLRQVDKTIKENSIALEEFGSLKDYKPAKECKICGVLGWCYDKKHAPSYYMELEYQKLVSGVNIFDEVAKVIFVAGIMALLVVGLSLWTTSS